MSSTSFVRAHAFDHVGVFTYSHEEGTSAYALDDDVPPRDKTSRRRPGHGPAEAAGAAAAAPPGRRACAAPHRRPVRRARPGAEGRLASQAPDIDASVYLTECDPSSYRPGDFVEVAIVGARDYDLIARPVL